MGDIIHSMIALQFIKKQIPDCQIDWIVEEGFKGILQNNPHIDNILGVNLKSIKKNKLELFNQTKLLRNYAKNNYDIVIDAQGLIKSSLVSKLVGDRVVGSFIVGFDKDSIRESLSSWFYDKTVTIGYEKNVIERSIKVLCAPFDIKVSKKDILNKEPFLFSKNNKNTYKDIFVFVIGASKLNKVYPKEKFLELAQRLNEKVVVVWGNEEEYQIANWLKENSDLIDVAPKGNLDDLKNIVANAKLVIGSDTGPTHMAWALNIPSITIFGNTPEYRNTYITEINRVVKSDSYVDPLNLDKSDFSIKDIKASKIVELIIDILKK